jgi:hypothetical protein
MLKPGDRVRMLDDEGETSDETVGPAWMRLWGLAGPVAALDAGTLGVVIAVRDEPEDTKDVGWSGVAWRSDDGREWTSDAQALEKLESSS